MGHDWYWLHTCLCFIDDLPSKLLLLWGKIEDWCIHLYVVLGTRGCHSVATIQRACFLIFTWFPISNSLKMVKNWQRRTLYLLWVCHQTYVNNTFNHQNFSGTHNIIWWSFCRLCSIVWKGWIQNPKVFVSSTQLVSLHTIYLFFKV